MKKNKSYEKILLFGVFILISLNSFAQDRIAILSTKKDTLYILNNELGKLMIELWQKDKKDYIMPMFIKLTSEEFNRKLSYYKPNNRENNNP